MELQALIYLMELQALIFNGTASTDLFNSLKVLKLNYSIFGMSCSSGNNIQ